MKRSPSQSLLCTTALLLSAQVLLAVDLVPARRVGGALPQIPISAIGWTEARLDVRVDASGAVSRVTGLRATPGALTSIAAVIEGWRFQAASYANRPVASAVLVETMIRPPQLYDNVAAGSPPVDLADASDAVPAPIVEQRPKYPIAAQGDGVVLVEVLVGIDGRVEKAVLVQADPGFDGVALEAARLWTFRPARYQGQPATSYAYLIFGFRSPVTVVQPGLPGE